MYDIVFGTKCKYIDLLILVSFFLDYQDYVKFDELLKIGCWFIKVYLGYYHHKV